MTVLVTAESNRALVNPEGWLYEPLSQRRESRFSALLP
jgi:hypothetical protein